MLFNKLIWYDNYASKIDMIDEQHKQLFEGFNEFYNEINLGHFNKEVIDNFISVLDFYTTTHFDTEEAMMLKENYPNYVEHKRRHEFFKSLYEEIRDNKFFRHSAAHIFSVNLATTAAEWWEAHIVTYDKELTAFLKELDKGY